MKNQIAEAIKLLQGALELSDEAAAAPVNAAMDILAKALKDNSGNDFDKGGN